VSCAFCEMIAACERDPVAPLPIGSCSCASDELELDILLVDDPKIYELARRPMFGRALRVSWPNLCAWLSRPLAASTKAEHGAWTPAKFRENRKKKDHLQHASALLVDVDEGGDVAQIAKLLGNLAAVHSTFSSTREAPRCRIVLPLAAPVDASTYEAVFRVVAAHLLAAGIGVDEGTKDAGRLGFLPCVREGGFWQFVAVDGPALDAVGVLAAQPPTPPRSEPRLPKPEHRDRYVAAALEKAAAEVSRASDGARHYTLSKEAFALARLDLSESAIAAVLLPAFVAAAGERREHEGSRTIRDAVRARGAK
jgi:hypothetical protein